MLWSGWTPTATPMKQNWPHRPGRCSPACRSPTTTAGFARLLEWIAEHAPGPRIVAAVEGTRSYGIGLTRALTAAGLQVIECEQPARKDRRGRGKSDAIDAHLAVLFALRQDTDKLPTPRSDGPREALRILLAARQEMVTASTGQINRLRALLLSGDDRDRDASRAAFTDQALSQLARRRLPADADRLRRRCATVRSAGSRSRCARPPRR